MRANSEIVMHIGSPKRGWREASPMNNAQREAKQRAVDPEF